MTQPKFSPIPIEDEVRPGYHLGVPAPWVADRPGDLGPGAIRAGDLGGARNEGRGVPGPDQGYALRLAELFESRLVLEAGERPKDVLAGAVAIAMRRAALFGRAPVTGDLELALGLFGFLDPAPAALVVHRKALFTGVDHDYWARRELASLVPGSTLRMVGSDVREQLSRWDELFQV